MKVTPDYSIILVNYNGKHFLKDCLHSIKKESEDLSLEVILVDNNSNDGSREFVKQNFPWVHLLKNENNVGFAVANNQAIDLSSGRYILLLNPDTVIYSGALKKMIEIIDNDHHIGALSCMLLNTDNSLQYSIGRFPSWYYQIAESLFLHRLFPSLNLTELEFNKKKYNQFHEIDWAFGAALIIRKSIFEKVGKLDEKFFFVSEEKDLCYRIKKAGWKIFYVPTAKILHHGRGWREDHNIDKAIVKGRLRFAKKHYSKIKSGTYKLFLTMNVSIHCFIWLIASFLLISKRTLAIHNFKKYSAVLKITLINN